MTYRLFGDFAHAYDLHTPPDHYYHDHAMVLDLARSLGDSPRLLDVGCGTGVLVAKALAAGIRAEGIDASSAMIAEARVRVPWNAVAVHRMQDVREIAAYDILVMLSWVLNYSQDENELVDVLGRCFRAVRRSGWIAVQTAHADNATGETAIDEEAGPSGTPRDVRLSYRFERVTPTRPGGPSRLRATYEYACRSQREVLSESHVLVGADAYWLASRMLDLGATSLSIMNSGQRDPFTHSISPILVARVDDR